jgi:serine/threonine protein kinase
VEGHDTKSDIYQIGVLIYEMLVGLPPYYDAVDTQKMFDSILNAPLKLPPKISTEASDLLQRLLKKQPHLRPSIKEVK